MQSPCHGSAITGAPVTHGLLSQHLSVVQQNQVLQDKRKWKRTIFGKSIALPLLLLPKEVVISLSFPLDEGISAMGFL